MREPRYRVNRAQVVDEVIDGEAVMINLTTGSYYCTNPAGALVWEALAAGSTATAAAAGLRARFDVSADQAAADVRALLAELDDQGLVVAEEADEPAPTDAGAGTEPYESPRLETFTDLQDLLLLDPVHDVDSTGWPHAAE